MTQPLAGIHHITALAGDAQRNAEFYTAILGLRLIKKTVNFDAPDVYHLYYGDNLGTPGTLITFFPFPRAARGSRGAGEVSSISFHAPANALDYWITHLTKRGVSLDVSESGQGGFRLTFQDPDALSIHLDFSSHRDSFVGWSSSPIPPQYAIRRFSGLTLSVHEVDRTSAFLSNVMKFSRIASDGKNRLFTAGTDHSVTITLREHPTDAHAGLGAGSIHHVAWRVPDPSCQEEWQAAIRQAGTYVTEVADRQYFQSIYFREPGGILFEIATDGPGFLIDESWESLGTELMLPPWLESERSHIESTLPSLSLPVSALTANSS